MARYGHVSNRCDRSGMTGKPPPIGMRTYRIAKAGPRPGSTAEHRTVCAPRSANPQPPPIKTGALVD
jgi:hypothetical protein